MSKAFAPVSDFLPSSLYIPEPRLLSPRSPQNSELVASIYQRLSLESLFCQDYARNLNPLGFQFPVTQVAPYASFPFIVQQNLLPISVSPISIPAVCPVPTLTQPWINIVPTEEPKPPVTSLISLKKKRSSRSPSRKKDKNNKDEEENLKDVPKSTSNQLSYSTKEIQNSLISATAAVAASVVTPAKNRCPSPISPDSVSAMSTKELATESSVTNEGQREEKPATGSDSTPYVCPFIRCGLRFSRRFSLMRHMKKHMGYSPFVCPFRECGKRYAEASTLKRHLRVHTGEKPYVCQYKGCTKRFGDPSNLKRHELIHSGRKPYKCPHPDCKDKSGFTRGNSLRQHMVQKHRFEMDDPIVLDSISLRYKRRRLEREEEEQRQLQEARTHAQSETSSSPLSQSSPPYSASSTSSTPTPFVPPAYLLVNDQMLPQYFASSQEQTSSQLPATATPQ